ncbi:MAG TPA: GNAT family N-acetyltransferase [Gemmatimonadaceae bacterium]
MTVESRAVTREAAVDSPRFTIERARAEDADSIAPLFDAYRQFYGAAPDLASARTFVAARLERDESVVLLARARSRASDMPESVGFAQLYPSFSSVSVGPIVILNDLYVLPAWRRSGIARSLIEESARHGERVGALRVHLSTQLTNAPALRLYQSLGFVADQEFAHMSLALPAAATAP